MAYSEEQWLSARGYFEAGLSLAKIQEKTGIARSSVSKKAKTEQWQHGENLDYIEAKTLIVNKKSTKSQQVLNCADEVAFDRIRREGLVYGNAEKLAKKIGELAEMIEDPQDIKNLVDANDKNSITLKVSERHAPKQVTAIQVNEKKEDPRIGMAELYKVINE